MTSEEKLNCLTDRPCDVCNYHKENGCSKWACVFEQEPDPKNDLGVDCISRAEAIKCLECDFDITGKENMKTVVNYINSAHDKIVNLPSVTPIRPKGHWILTDVEGNKVWHCNCSECGKDPQDYVGGSENWWLIKSKLPKFCPSCGSDNREVVEE